MLTAEFNASDANELDWFALWQHIKPDWNAGYVLRAKRVPPAEPGPKTYVYASLLAEASSNIERIESDFTHRTPEWDHETTFDRYSLASGGGYLWWVGADKEEPTKVAIGRVPLSLATEREEEWSEAPAAGLGPNAIQTTDAYVYWLEPELGEGYGPPEKLHEISGEDYESETLCTAVVEGVRYVYWTQPESSDHTEAIGRAVYNPVTGKLENVEPKWLLMPGGHEPWGLAVGKGHLFWRAEFPGGEHPLEIWTAKLDGTGIRSLWKAPAHTFFAIIGIHNTPTLTANGLSLFVPIVKHPTEFEEKYYIARITPEGNAKFEDVIEEEWFEAEGSDFLALGCDDTYLYFSQEGQWIARLPIEDHEGFEDHWAFVEDEPFIEPQGYFSLTEGSSHTLFWGNLKFGLEPRLFELSDANVEPGAEVNSSQLVQHGGSGRISAPVAFNESVPTILFIQGGAIWSMSEQGGAKIRRRAMAGGETETVLHITGETPVSFAIGGGYLFWITEGTPATIGRAKLNGTEVLPDWKKLERWENEGDVSERGMACGLGFLYFSGVGEFGQAIGRVRFDGEELEQEWVLLELKRSGALAHDGERLYYIGNILGAGGEGGVTFEESPVFDPDARIAGLATSPIPVEEGDWEARLEVRRGGESLMGEAARVLFTAETGWHTLGFDIIEIGPGEGKLIVYANGVVITEVVVKPKGELSSLFLSGGYPGIQGSPEGSIGLRNFTMDGVVLDPLDRVEHPLSDGGKWVTMPWEHVPGSDFGEEGWKPEAGFPESGAIWLEWFGQLETEPEPLPPPPLIFWSYNRNAEIGFAANTIGRAELAEGPTLINTQPEFVTTLDVDSLALSVRGYLYASEFDAEVWRIGPNGEIELAIIGLRNKDMGVNALTFDPRQNFYATNAGDDAYYFGGIEGRTDIELTEVVALGFPVFSIVADEDFLYGNSPTVNGITRARHNGSEQIDNWIASGIFVAGGLVVAGEWIYWTTATGVGRAKRDGSSVNPVWLTDPAPPRSPGPMATDGQNIYWGRGEGIAGAGGWGYIATAPLDGPALATFRWFEVGGQIFGLTAGNLSVKPAEESEPIEIGGSQEGVVVLPNATTPSRR